MSRCVSVLLLLTLVHLDRLGSAQPVDQMAQLRSLKAAVEELQAERNGEQRCHLLTGTPNFPDSIFSKTDVSVCSSAESTSERSRTTAEEGQRSEKVFLLCYFNLVTHFTKRSHVHPIIFRLLVFYEI